MKIWYQRSLLGSNYWRSLFLLWFDRYFSHIFNSLWIQSPLLAHRRLGRSAREARLYSKAKFSIKRWQSRYHIIGHFWVHSSLYFKVLYYVYQFSPIQKLELITLTKILHLGSFDRDTEGSLNMAYYESDSSEICLQSNPYLKCVNHLFS